MYEQSIALQYNTRFYRLYFMFPPQSGVLPSYQLDFLCTDGDNGRGFLDIILIERLKLHWLE